MLSVPRSIILKTSPVFLERCQRKLSPCKCLKTPIWISRLVYCDTLIHKKDLIIFRSPDEPVAPPKIERKLWSHFLEKYKTTKDVYIATKHFFEINLWIQPRLKILKEKIIFCSKLYMPSTLNIDPILRHTQLIVCQTCCVCSRMLNRGLNHRLFLSLFKLYTPPHKLNCIK